MLRTFLLIPIYILFFTSILFSFDGTIPVYTMQAVTLFDGDKHGEFKDNLVAILSDGSGWKIHPQDHGKFNKWNHHDAIQVRKRTSMYWFKREHKFELHNLSNHEDIRVMLVRYPEYPTYILGTDTYIAEVQIRTFTWQDVSGWVHYNSYTVPIYHKLIYLSDGTSWNIKDDKQFPYFNLNNYVYMGYNNEKKGISPFMVTGLQREARWTWVYP